LDLLPGFKAAICELPYEEICLDDGLVLQELVVEALEELEGRCEQRPGAR